MELLNRPIYHGASRLLAAIAGALAIGAVVGFVVWLGDRESSVYLYLLIGAWLGLWINASINLLLFLLWRFLERLSGWRQRLAHAATFFVSASSGFGAGAASLPMISGGRIVVAPDWISVVTLGGGLGVFLGLSALSYERLKARLEDSMALIKEQEFAARELETARQIQSRLLPPAEISGSGYRIVARNEPARVVAGDFYDVFPQANGSLGLVVADVSGKGVAASLVMASVKAALPLLAADRSVAETLAALNAQLLEQLGPREFVAVCYGRYDPASGELEFANAGLPDPYLLRPGAPPRPLEVDGPRLPLGLRAGQVYETLRARVEPGERLLMLTDGLPEAVTGGEPLGYERLEEVLAAGRGDLEHWLAGLFEEVERLTSEARDDDWTALGLERLSRSTVG